MKTKKLLFTLILISLFCGLNAQTFKDENGVSYSITSRATREVQVNEQGVGALSGSVVIPDSLIYEDTYYRVTSLAVSAFAYNKGMTSIKLPVRMSSIGRFAFRVCTALSSIEIPEGITTIEDYTFTTCEALRSVKFSSTVQNLKSYAFENCIALKDVALSSSLTSIGDFAFIGCSSLSTLQLPLSLKTIGMFAFRSCNKLQKINIPSSVTSIGKSSFLGCASLVNITIPASVTAFGPEEFGAPIEIYNLSKVEMPSGNYKLYTPLLGNIPCIINNKDTVTSVAKICYGDSLKVEYLIPNSDIDYIYTADTFKIKPCGTYDLSWNSKDDVENIFDLKIDISKAPLNILLKDTTKVYGQETVFIYEYDGFKNGDTEDNLDIRPELTIIEKMADVGEYKLKMQQGSDHNYSLILQDTIFTVIQGNDVILWDQQIDSFTINDTITPNVISEYSALIKYNIADPSIISLIKVDGKDVFKMLAAGTTTVEAFTEDTDNFMGATPVSKTFTVSNANSILKEKDTNTFSFCPVDNMILINGINEYSKIFIYDLSGKLIYSTKAGGASLVVDTNSWPLGGYIAKIVSNGKVEMYKFIKNK